MNIAVAVSDIPGISPSTDVVGRGMAKLRKIGPLGCLRDGQIVEVHNPFSQPVRVGQWILIDWEAGDFPCWLVVAVDCE